MNYKYFFLFWRIKSVFVAPEGTPDQKLRVARRNVTDAIDVEAEIEAEVQVAQKDLEDAKNVVVTRRKVLAGVKSRHSKAVDHVRRCKSELMVAKRAIEEEKNNETVKRRLFQADSEEVTDAEMAAIDMDNIV